MKLLRVKLPAAHNWCRVTDVDPERTLIDWRPLPRSGIQLLYEGTILLEVLRPRVTRIYRLTADQDHDGVGVLSLLEDREFHAPADAEAAVEVICGASAVLLTPDDAVKALLETLRAYTNCDDLAPGYMDKMRAALEARAAGTAAPIEVPFSFMLLAQELSEESARALLDLLSDVSDLYELEQRWGSLRQDTRAVGLRPRYRVERTDGRDRPGRDRHGAALFVLDVTYDPHSKVAAAAYAQSVRLGFPALANDLMRLPGVLAALEDSERHTREVAGEMMSAAIAARRDALLGELEAVGVKPDDTVALLVAAHLTMDAASAAKLIREGDSNALGSDG